MADDRDRPAKALQDAAAASERTETIPIAEERLVVERRARETGRVRVDVRTETMPETVSAELKSVTADVERVRIDRPIEPGEALPQMREEDGVTIVPIFEEVLVVETRLVLREELRLTRRESVETVSTEVPLRRQTAEIVHEGPDGEAPEGAPRGD